MSCYSQEEINELVTFADISENSFFPDEQEVLFDLGATFEIEDVESYSSDNDYFLIRLILSCEGANISRDYRQNCRYEIKSSSATLMLGELLFNTGKYTAAQHYFEQLLNDPGNENLHDTYHYLGWAHMRQEDYGRAIIYFERAHDLTLTTDGISRARILNSMGKALVANGYIEEPFIYYQKALDLRIACLGLEHDDVADSYANLARLCNLAGNSQLAVEYYEKSIKKTNINAVESVNREGIKTTTEEFDSMKCSEGSSDSLNEFDHSSRCENISDSLYELGFIQWELGESASGLSNMKRSLSLDKRSLSHSATKLHRSFHSLGNLSPLVNYNRKEIDYRLRCLDDAKRHPLTSGTEMVEALENVGSAYAADRQFKKALSYYLSALTQREKQKNKNKCPLQIARTESFIGDMHCGLHQFEEALNWYIRAATSYKKYPSEANRDRLRTRNKIIKVKREISLKTSAFTTTQISRNKTASTSPSLDTKQKINRRQTQSPISNSFCLHHSFFCTWNRICSASSADLE